jgi:xanthine dehydrogenase accessory factor
MELSIYQSAAELLRRGVGFAYAVIILQDGSTPRESGAKMLILPDRIVGTIGGGPMEGSVMAEARKLLRDGGAMRLVQYDMSGRGNAEDDPICGGLNEVFIARIDAGSPSGLAVFEAAARAEQDGIPAWMYYVIDENEGAEAPCLITVNVDGEIVGELRGNEKKLRYMMESPLRTAVHGESRDGVRYVADRVGSISVMYIFGGGHGSLEIARLAQGLGFRVVVLDDREEFANTQRFPGCETMVLEDFRHIPDFPVGGNTYLVIVTRGHAHDRVTLQWALGKKPKYTGMIGSRVKRDQTYKSLEEAGWDRALLDAVHCPIGLAIGAKTPAEIAVSIMAEIIQIKNGQ